MNEYHCITITQIISLILHHCQNTIATEPYPALPYHSKAQSWSCCTAAITPSPPSVLLPFSPPVCPPHHQHFFQTLFTNPTTLSANLNHHFPSSQKWEVVSPQGPAGVVILTFYILGREETPAITESHSLCICIL